MTKAQYHSILFEKLQEANSDIITWPGIAPGQYIPTVMMDEMSQSALTNSHQQALVAELRDVSELDESEDLQNRHDSFLKMLNDFEPAAQ